MNLVQQRKTKEDFGLLSTELHHLIDRGQGDSAKADDVREKMEAIWPILSDEDARDFQSMSANRNRQREAFEPQDLLSSSVHVTGTIKVRRALIIDGTIEGNITSDGLITIGSNGQIHGDIQCKNAVVLGRVYGNIKAERCELRAHALIHGDIQVARIVIQEGASFVGRAEMIAKGRVAGGPALVRQEATTQIASFGAA